MDKAAEVPLYQVLQENYILTEVPHNSKQNV